MSESVLFEPWHVLQREILTQKNGLERLVGSLFAQIDSEEPYLKAWVCLDRKGALDCARQLDDRLAKGESPGPLTGMPVGIKDIFHLRGFATGAGIAGWSSQVELADAPLVATLRQNGAIILGKTVTTPLACFDPPPTKNPWHAGHTPGGSSSGSAAALAAGMIAGALGSQTGGSLCRPAAYCGISALKPTFGLLSLEGVLPISHDLDHPGPMARDLTDLTHLFHALCGTRPPLESSQTIHLGIPQGMFAQESTQVVRDHWQRSQKTLARTGIVLSEVLLPADFAELLGDHLTLMAHGAWMTHRVRFEKEPALFPARVSELITRGRAISACDVDLARRSIFRRQRQLAPLMEGQDAWLLPGFHDFPPGPDSTGIPRFHAPWSFLGWPEVSFATEVATNGLPMGLQLVSRPHSDARLLQIAQSIQRILGHVRFPSSLPIR